MDANDSSEPVEANGSPRGGERAWNRLKKFSSKGAVLGSIALSAIIVCATVLVYSGKVCGIDEIGTSGIRGLRACDVSGQLRQVIDAGNAQEMEEVALVVASDDRLAKLALNHLFNNQEEAYFQQITRSNRDARYLEERLRAGSFFSTRTSTLADEFADHVKDALGGDAAVGNRSDLLTEDRFISAQNKIDSIELLRVLRRQATKREGPFYPLGTPRVASLPGSGRPDSCTVYVKANDYRHGSLLRIDGPGSDFVVREAMQSIPDRDSRGQEVEIDLHVNSEDASTLRLNRLPSGRRGLVYVRVATAEDFEHLPQECQTARDGT